MSVVAVLPCFRRARFLPPTAPRATLCPPSDLEGVGGSQQGVQVHGRPRWQGRRARARRHDSGVARAEGHHALLGLLALRGQEAARSGEKGRKG